MNARSQKRISIIIITDTLIILAPLPSICQCANIEGKQSDLKQFDLTQSSLQLCKILEHLSESTYY